MSWLELAFVRVPVSFELAPMILAGNYRAFSVALWEEVRTFYGVRALPGEYSTLVS